MDAAKDGDTIIVYSGIYTENIDVNKELKIISKSGNPEDTVVQPFNDGDYIFHVTANNVTISGFKVGGSAWGQGMAQGIYLDEVRYNNISDNEISGCIFVIDLNFSSNNTLHNNNCYDNYNSVRLRYSDNNLLTNNGFGSYDYGIEMDYSNNNIVTGNDLGGSEYGLLLGHSGNNTLSNNNLDACWAPIMLGFSDNNTVSNNSASTIETAIDLRSSGNNTVSNNDVSFSSIAVSLVSSTNNKVSNNSVNASGACFDLKNSNSNALTGNIARQIGYEEDMENIYLTNSMDNLIYNNYFDSHVNAYDDGNNIWNITKTPGTNIIGGPFLGGNYWSDYGGADTDGDGLGDTLLPYDSEGQIASGGDYLPLVKPTGPPAPAAVYTVNNGAG